MDVKNVRYLNSLSDKSQYPAVRCAMGPNIYMYHCLASSAVESMNTANRQIRAGVALDGLHAIILPGKLECNRFDKASRWLGVVIPSLHHVVLKSMTACSMTFTKACTISFTVMMMSIGNVVCSVMF